MIEIVVTTCKEMKFLSRTWRTEVISGESELHVDNYRLCRQSLYSVVALKFLRCQVRRRDDNLPTLTLIPIVVLSSPQTVT